MENAIKTNDSLFRKIWEYKIGVIPIPLYAVMATVIYLASIYNKLPADMIGGFGVLMVMGVLLGHLGGKIPVLKEIGGPAIFTIFIPSMMVYYHFINPNAIKAITALMKGSNFLYLYISCLITGSILGMNKSVLVKGFLKMFVPLIVGTFASIGVGILVGLLFGYTPQHTFFYVITPIISGGIGEGILPLAMGYSEVLNKSQEAFIGQLIPAAMLGNIIAIIFAGILKRVAEKKPELTGNGVLIKDSENEEKVLEEKEEVEKPIDFQLMGAGLLLACTFFIFGGLANKFIGIPGPIIMIFSAAIVKYFKLLPDHIELGAFQLYRFITKSLTWPLLVGVGVVYTPWKDLVKAVSPAYIAICLAVVIAMIASGYFVGKIMNMYPVESALVTACHSGLGGTGDVSILSSAERMELMPFSQISTRIGGAATVVVAIMLMKLIMK